MKNKLSTAALILATAMAPFAVAHAADDSAPVSQSKPMKAVKDSVITTKIKSKLAEERDGYTKSVSVKTTDKGAVHLTGATATKAQSERVEAIARDTDGVTSVTNDIKVTSN